MPVSVHTSVEDETRRVVECARCGGAMRVVPSATRGLHYLECTPCRVKLASAYDEVVENGTAARRRREAPDEDARWNRIRDAAQAFWRRIEDEDPYATLGLPPGTDLSTVRARYHVLAAEHHPDHGGSPEAMRRIIEAYRTIRGR